METAIELRRRKTIIVKEVRKENNYIFELIMWKNICKKILNPSFNFLMFQEENPTHFHVVSEGIR